MVAHALPGIANYKAAEAGRPGRTAWAQSAFIRQRVVLTTRATARIAKQVFAILLRLAADGLVLANFLYDSFTLVKLAAFGLDLLNPATFGQRTLALLGASLYLISASIHYHILAIPVESRTLSSHLFEIYASSLIVL